MTTFPLEKSAYKILQPVGKGATATVYSAQCLTNGKTVALKMIDLEACPIELESLRHEVAFWSSSQSPNIVNYYGSFVDGSTLYIIMEYMSAGSCYEIMRYAHKKGIENELVIASLLHEVLQALVYFHENRQIHRDIKAGNILLNDAGDVKIGDFGIAANLVENGTRKRARFTVIGTPCYMAPEVLKEEEGYTEKADIWSLGITAIELALGAAPYSTLFPLEIIVKIVNSPPPQLPDDSRFSPAFKDFVKTCLVTQPTKRPTARQLLEHKFMKQIKDPHAYTKQLVTNLLPLTTRFEMNHSVVKPETTPKPESKEPAIEWDFGEYDPNPKKTSTTQQTNQNQQSESSANQSAETTPKVDSTISQTNKQTSQQQATQPQHDPNQQPTTVKKGIFTITTSRVSPSVTPSPPPQQTGPKIGKAEDLQASKEEEERIKAMTIEVNQLKERIGSLQMQNTSLKSQIDELSNELQKLMN